MTSMKRIAPALGYDTEEKNAYREDVIRSLFLRRADLANKKYLCLPSSEGLEIPLVIAKGISQENIIAVDRDEELFAHWRNLYPTVRVMIGEIEEVVKRLSLEEVIIDYANLDLCGVRSANTATILTSIREEKIWASDARVAVTIIKGRDDLTHLTKFRSELQKSGDNRIYFAFNCLTRNHNVIKTGSYRLIGKASHTVEYGVMEVKNGETYDKGETYSENEDEDEDSIARKLLAGPNNKIVNKFDNAYVPSREEIFHLLEITKKHQFGKRNAAILACSYFLGCSTKQISELKIDDIVNPDDGNFNEKFIVKSYTGGRGGTGNRIYERTIYLSHKIVLTLLRDYLEEVQDTSFFNDSPYLFHTNRNKKFGKTLRDILIELHKKAGINGSSKSGRRWYIFTILNKGLEVNTISKLLGISISSVQKYLHELEQKKQKTTNLSTISAMI